MKKMTYTTALAFVAVVICMITLVLLSFTIPPKPKQFLLNEEQAAKLFQAIQISQGMIPYSTKGTPEQATVALQNFTEIQKVIGEQYKAQTDTVKPKK